MKLFVIAEDFSNKLKSRQEILEDLVKEIKSGEFRQTSTDPNKMYELHNSVRHEYQSPKDVGGHNANVKRIFEMEGAS